MNQTVNVRVSGTAKAALDAVARERGISLSAVVRAALADAVRLSMT